MSNAKTKEHDAVRLLRALHRDTAGSGLIELRAIPHDKSLQIDRTWTSASTEVIEFADEFGDRRSGYSAYYGVCKRSREGGKKDDVLCATALWADIDTTNNGWSLEATYRALYGLRGVLRPSIVVASGGGVHAYWLLDEPYALGGDRARIDAVERANRAVSYYVGGDSVHDVARVMRLPGTWNSKRGVSGAKRCEIVYCMDHDRKRMADIADAVAGQKTALYNGEWLPAKVVEAKMHSPLAAGMDDDDPIGKVFDAVYGRKGGASAETELEAMWRDRVRYRPSRGYMGIDEAVLRTTARLWCAYTGRSGSSGETTAAMVVNRTMKFLHDASVRWDDGAWSEDKQRSAIRQKIERWAPKWAELKRAADAAKKKARAGGTAG